MKLFKLTVPLIYFLALTASAYAAELEIYSHKREVKVSEQFQVDVMINSEEAINAIEGRLLFPAAELKVVAVKDGDSVINFWLEKPSVSKEGGLIFSGITPGGFSGPRQNIFSLVLEAKTTGTAEIYVDSLRALRNDGEATEVDLIVESATVSIVPGDSRVRNFAAEDSDPPEDFALEITQSPHLFNNDYFLVFGAEDKGSGVSHYVLREFRFPFLALLTKFEMAESPYLLKDQELKSHIEVKAVDYKGNERKVVLLPTNALATQDYWPLAVIIVLLIAFFLFLTKKYGRKTHQ